MELFALDGNLNPIGVIQFQSLIWIDRYNRVGTCEVYAPATEKNIELLKDGNYIYRSDFNDMICRIRDVKIKDNPDSGTFITALGLDAKYYLDSRINTTLDVFNSYELATDDLEILVYNALTDSSKPGNALEKLNGDLLFGGREQSGIGGTVTQSVFGMSYGEMARQILGSLNCGYKVKIEFYGADPDAPNILKFLCRQGSDRSASVWFAEIFDNIGDTEYERDSRDKGNAIYIYVPDENLVGLYIVNQTSGIDETGTERYERIVDSTNSRIMSYGNIKQLVEGTFSLSQNGSNVDVKATNMLIPVLSFWQSGRISLPGNWSTRTEPYWKVSSTVTIATAENIQVADVTDDTNFTLINELFDYVLMCQGVEESRNYKVKETVDVSIVNNRFVYRQDYFLGDVVRIVPPYGEPEKARIVEVMECWDDSGYHLEPRTSYTDAE